MFLRVLDYYRGYEWSRAHVAEEVAKSWLDGGEERYRVH
jgi:hypothetical protein